MADLKSATLRNVPGIVSSPNSPQAQTDLKLPIQSDPVVGGDGMQDAVTRQLEPVSDLIADFAEPSSRTNLWLGDPRLVATLAAASAVLAPGGATEDGADRYAASVIETHLVARRRLTKLTNALLKS